MRAINNVQRYIGSIRRKRRAGLASVISEGVDKTVIVIHQHHSNTLSRWTHLMTIRSSRHGRIERAEKAGGLEAALFLFRRRIRIVEQRCTRGVMCSPILQMNRANENASIDVAVQADHAHGAAVPAPSILFEIFNRLRGSFLRRPNNRYRPHVRNESI